MRSIAKKLFHPMWRPFKRRFDKLDRVVGNLSLMMKDQGGEVVALRREIAQISGEICELESGLDELKNEVLVIRRSMSSVEKLLVLVDTTGEKTLESIESLMDVSENEQVADVLVEEGDAS